MVKTQYFGEAFEEELVENYVNYRVQVFPPLNVQRNENVTLHIKIEKHSIQDLYKGLRYSDKDRDEVQVQNVPIDAEAMISYKNFTPPGSVKMITLERKLTMTDLSNMTKMPGFKVSWYYSGDEEVVSQPKYLTQMKTKYFIR